METKELDIFKGQLDILGLEHECKKLDQVNFPVKHTFADGVYIRTMTGLKGCFAIGKRHRNQIVNIIIKGKALIYSGDGQAKEIKAGELFISDPYVKKMAFFLEDTEWINIHPTKETDLDKIEQEVIICEDDYNLFLEEQKKISGGL